MKFRAKPNSDIDGSIATEVEESKNIIETNDIKVNRNFNFLPIPYNTYIITHFYFLRMMVVHPKPI